MILKRAVSTRERDYVTRFDEEFFIPRSIVGRAEDYIHDQVCRALKHLDPKLQYKCPTVIGLIYINDERCRGM
jgi:hypothetical protein